MLPSATPAFFAISGVVVPWYPCVVKSSSAARTRRWCVRSAWLIGRESNVPAEVAPGFLPVPPLTSFPAARRPVVDAAGGSFAMRMLVLGSGLQGSACAYDLLQQRDVEKVTLADLRPERLPAFLRPLVGKRLAVVKLDVRDGAALRATLQGHDAVLSALPYYFNLGRASRGRSRPALRRPRRQHGDRLQPEEARPGSVRPERLRDHRLRARAGHGERARGRGDPARRRRGDREDLRGRTATAPRAAAQLPDRVLPGRSARLLHDAVLGAAGRQADARRRAVGSRARDVSAAGGRARGLPHGRRHLDA